MKWILIYIVLTADFAKLAQYETYDTMPECFDAREKLVETVGKPIINYQIICIPKDPEEVEWQIH